MVIRRVQIGSLYKLMDETLVREVGVASAEMVSPTVWHQRWEYMSEHGLQLSSNKELFLGCKLAPLKFCEDYIYGK